MGLLEGIRRLFREREKERRRSLESGEINTVLQYVERNACDLFGNTRFTDSSYIDLEESSLMFVSGTYRDRYFNIQAFGSAVHAPIFIKTPEKEEDVKYWGLEFAQFAIEMPFYPGKSGTRTRKPEKSSVKSFLDSLKTT